MKLELLDFTELKDYPSGSGIEFYDDQIYIVGDNYRDLLTINKKWTKPKLLNLFDTTEKKTVKSPKSDLESMTLLSVEKKPHLLIIGSGSTDKRNKALLYNLKNNTKTWLDLSLYYNRIKAAGISELNIEGIAEVYDYLVLVNGGNTANPANHLIITKSDFWKNQEKASLQTIVIDFENTGVTNSNMIITGITYSDVHEDLFLTVSSLDTFNAKGEAKPGKTCLAIIENLYRKIGREKGKIKVNKLIDLGGEDKKFAGYKMESVCIQSQKDHSIKLQLLADSKNSKLQLFKIGLDW